MASTLITVYKWSTFLVLLLNTKSLQSVFKLHGSSAFSLFIKNDCDYPWDSDKIFHGMDTSQSIYQFPYC